MKTLGKFLFLTVLLVSAAGVHAGPGDIVKFSQSGSVIATLTGNEGGFSHLLDLATTRGTVTSPIFSRSSSVATGFADSAIGGTYNLGTYIGMSELEFRLSTYFMSASTPYDQLFTGPGSRNADNGIYANVTYVDATHINVGFNDLGAYPSRATFDNLQFSLELIPDQVVPEPSSFALMGLALAGLAGTRLRRSIKPNA